LTPFSQKFFPAADAAVINIRGARDEHDVIVTSFLLSLGFMGSRASTHTAAPTTAFLGVFQGDKTFKACLPSSHIPKLGVSTLSRFTLPILLAHQAWDIPSDRDVWNVAK